MLKEIIRHCQEKGLKEIYIYKSGKGWEAYTVNNKGYLKRRKIYVKFYKPHN